MDDSIQVEDYLEDGYKITVDTNHWFRFRPNKDNVLVEVSFGHDGEYDAQMVRAKRRKALQALKDLKKPKTLLVTSGLTTAHQR